MFRYWLISMGEVKIPSPPGWTAWLRVRPEHTDEPMSLLSCSRLRRERLWRVDAAWTSGRCLHNHGYGQRPDDGQVVLPDALGAVLDARIVEQTPA